VNIIPGHYFFLHFQFIFSHGDLDRARQADRQAVTYRMVSGTLWRSPDCLFPSRCEGIEHFLLKLKGELPDYEIVVNTHDWPFINRHFYSSPVPLFSFSKTVDHSDIFFPAWTFWAGGPAIKHYPTG
jgi:EGF-domain serine glucosyl/xylosyltransferase